MIRRFQLVSLHSLLEWYSIHLTSKIQLILKKYQTETFMKIKNTVSQLGLKANKQQSASELSEIITLLTTFSLQ